MRPKTLDEFQGKSNQDVVERLRIAIASAKARKTALPHILLYGPAGTGKTTISYIIANEMGSTLIVRTGGSITKQSDLFSVMYDIDLLQSAGKDAVLLFDEIHKLSVDGMPEEMFYSLLEEYIFYSSLEGKKIFLHGEEGVVINSAVRTNRPFTIIGATTAPGLLQKPLRDRFTISCYLKPYSSEDLVKIIKFNSDKEDIKINEDAMIELARRARGTPRVVINFLRSCRDRAIYGHIDEINTYIVKEEMRLQGVEEDGLTALDLKILEALAKNPKGLGIKTLAGVCDIDSATLQDMIFPYLSASGYVKTTSKRFITDVGLKRIEKKA